MEAIDLRTDGEVPLEKNLFAGIVELIRPFRQITDLSNDSLTQLLSYGDQDLSNDMNRNILELT